MPSKQQQSNGQANVPVIIFGIDDSGKPKAARFNEKHAGLAKKAAAHLKLQVVPVNASLTEIATRLPLGRVHANGSSFVPSIRRDLYAKLVAAAAGADSGHAAGSIASAAAVASFKGGDAQLPKDWDSIAPGTLVIAQESHEDGWYEAIVVDLRGEMLTLRWRDFPREKGVTRHRLSVALLYPTKTAAPAADDQAAAAQPRSKPSAKVADKEASPNSHAFPRDWDNIDINALVLAKQDGPWGTWFEAIAIGRVADNFDLRWRDYPHILNIVRNRYALALLHPNGK
jgi:hypothetical protein